MAEQLPESVYERMTADERAKERLERQKLLVSLPKSSLEQKYMAFVATLTVEVQENLEDLLLLANALPGAPAAGMEASTIGLSSSCWCSSCPVARRREVRGPAWA